MVTTFVFSVIFSGPICRRNGIVAGPLVSLELCACVPR